MNEKEKRKLVPPDGGWGWIIVLGVGLVNLSTRSIEPSFGLLFGSLLQELSMGTTGAGVIFSTFEAIVNFSGIFVGPLLKSYSNRKIAFIGSLLTAAGLMMTSPAASMAHILITYSIVVGFGVGFSSSATFVSINHYFKEKRGQAVGIAMAGTGLGFLFMPQAVRYLTEEYNFAGSILIIGAFALNACAGSALLQPVEWHLKEVKEDEEEMIKPNGKVFDLSRQNSDTKLQSRYPTCPQITIEHIIEEEHDSEDGNPMSNPDNSILSFESHGKQEEKIPTRRVSDYRPRFYLSKPYRKFSLTDKEWLNHDSSYGDQSQGYAPKPMNKSSTEVKFDKYFEEGSRSPFGRYTNSWANIQNRSDAPTFLTPNNSMIRRRKSSTISNLSGLDFGGSCLYLHALENELRDEGVNLGKIKEPVVHAEEKKETLWHKISALMDFDLLKDPIYLNILFGVSIFYVAEANFKMIVPFFLADLGHTKSETAFCLSMMAASDIAARLILPPICDRVKLSRRTLFLISAVFCGISRSALAESHDWIQLETILIISGFFRGATLINFMLVIPEYCDDKLNKLPAALGIHMVSKGIFLISIGPLIGLVRDLANSFPVCIHVQNILIALCVLAWTIEYAIVKKKKPESGQSDVSSSV